MIFASLRIVFALVAAALIGLPASADAASRARLDDWTRDDLVPYVTEQLSRHPRFRGERIAIAALDNGAVAPHIDGLTATLRTELSDALLQQQGVRLTWDAAHGAGADCADNSAPGYFLGIDVTDNGNGSATVSVRALDRQERTFVPGFGLTWRGRLSRTESAALRATKADESLRGQRALPFDGGQADLVAARVAGKLACLLQRRGLDSRLSLPAGAEDEDAYAGRIESLVSNYLARGRLSTSQSAPALAISARLHPIEGNLAQLWVTATTASDGQALPAAAADVYVLTAPVALPPTPLLERARIVRSTTSRRCTDPRAWRSRDDVRPVVSGWPAEGCVALEVETDRPAYLFALAHAGDGRLQWVYPSACSRRSELEAVAGVRHFTLTELQGGAPPSLYVVATPSRSDARDLERHLRRLCGEEVSDSGALDRWLADFDAMLGDLQSNSRGNSRGDTQWRVVRTSRDNPGERT